MAYKAFRINRDSYCRMLAAMRDEGCTLADLHEVSGLHDNTLRPFVNTLLKYKLVHIEDWTEDKRGYRTVRVFRLGQGTNKRRPRKSKAEVMEAYRERQRQIKMNHAIVKTKCEAPKVPKP